MKKFIVFLLIFVMVISFGACTPKKPANDKDNIVGGNPAEQPGNKDNEVVEPTPVANSKEVTLYFANKKYIETGDESLEKLIPEKRVIEYGNSSLEEAVVRELMNGPKSDQLSSGIPTTAKLLGVEVADGTAFVNFVQEGMFGGSMQEIFTINQIVKSLIELDSIDRVQFLLDGKKAESLMGHFEISEPFENIQ